MISSIAKSIYFIIVFTVSMVVIFLLYARLILLNQQFYDYSFKDSTYQNISRALKQGAENEILRQTITSKEYENLTFEEKQAVGSQIKDFTLFINEENVKDLLSKNIRNILIYFNRGEGDLYLYLPIDNWGLPEETLTEIPDYLKGGGISVDDLLREQKLDTPENLRVLNDLRNLTPYVSVMLLIVFAFGMLLIFTVSFINKRDRLLKTGKLLTYLGMITLFLSWVFYSIQNIAIGKISLQTTWTDILVATLVPIFTKPLVYIMVSTGLFELFSGIILYNRKSK